MTKQIVLRFPASASQEYAATRADIKAFEEWSWSGPEKVPAVVEIEGYIRPGQGFGISAVRYTPEDAVACLKLLELAGRIFAVDYEAAAREKADKAAAKRRKADYMPAPKPASREQVPPSLRFLLCDEARSEAHRYYRDTELLGPVGLRNVADQLDARYPFMARLDGVLGGAIRRCLRTGAAVQPPAGGPYPWHWCGISVANGNPQSSAHQAAHALETMSKFPRRAVPTPRRSEGGRTYLKPTSVSAEAFAGFPSDDLHLIEKIVANANRDGVDPDKALRDWIEKVSTSDCPF